MTTNTKPEPITTRRGAIAGLSVGALAFTTSGARADSNGDANREITRDAEAIHQEVVFTASRERVYEALLDAKQFHKVVLLSGAVRSGMVKAPKPSEISREPGGAFAVFGGFVIGRQIELVPSTRIVQAWRPLDWAPGVYSIARFELATQGGGTHLVFDHTGFPKGAAEHLAQGWQENYWQPLEKVLR